MIFKVLHSIWVEVWYPRIDITLEFNIFGVWTFFRPTLEKEQSENKTLVANKYLHNRLFWRLSVNLRNSKTQWRNRYPFFLKVHLELCAKKKKTRGYKYTSNHWASKKQTKKSLKYRMKSQYMFLRLLKFFFSIPCFVH